MSDSRRPFGTLIGTFGECIHSEVVLIINLIFNKSHFQIISFCIDAPIEWCVLVKLKFGIFFFSMPILFEILGKLKIRDCNFLVDGLNFIPI